MVKVQRLFAKTNLKIPVCQTTVPGRNGSFGFPLWGKLSPQVTDEGEICGDSQFARRGGVTPPYGAIKIHRAVGAGHAPPATKWQREHYRSVRRGGH